jgi:uncharacterized protein (DUF4415 family)
MNVKSKRSRRNWRDPDDAPEITQEWVERANLYRGKKLVRRGRPPAAVRKVSTTLRLSPEVVEHFKGGGPGWQTRIDQALKRLVSRSMRR